MTDATTAEAEQYRRTAARFTELVRGVPDAATWDQPAPVAG